MDCLESESDQPRPGKASEVTTPITMVIDDPISRTRKRPKVVVIDSKSGKNIVDDSGIISGLLYRIGKRHEAVKEGRDSNRIGKKKTAEVSAKFGSDIADIILNTRLCFNLLIDSPGGDVIMQANWSKTIQNLNEIGHETSSYVSGNAMSAAAVLTNDTANKYATSKSIFMWHPVYNVKNISDLERRIMAFRETVRPYLEQNVKPEKRVEMITRLDKAEISPPNSEDIFIELDGKEMEYFGLAEQVTSDTEELASLYEKNNGLKINWLDFGDPVTIFFLTRILTEKIITKYPGLTLKLTIKNGGIRCKLPYLQVNRKTERYISYLVPTCVEEFFDSKGLEGKMYAMILCDKKMLK